MQTDASEHTRQSIRSYSQGAMDADASLARLMDWASKRDRETILVFFGDHLPPLGPVYVETGFMANRVASRTAPAADMMLQHETPLVLWSNKRGAERGTGTISPAFLPLHILDMAGMQHPYYTGFLRQLHERYRSLTIMQFSTARRKSRKAGNRGRHFLLSCVTIRCCNMT